MNKQRFPKLECKVRCCIFAMLLSTVQKSATKCKNMGGTKECVCFSEYKHRADEGGGAVNVSKMERPQMHQVSSIQDKIAQTQRGCLTPFLLLTESKSCQIQRNYPCDDFCCGTGYLSIL